MTLEKNVGFYKEDLKSGFGLVCFWKQGRGWDSQILYTLHEDFETNTLTPADECAAEIKRILAADPNAIAVNGYFHNLHCGEDYFNRAVVARRIRELYKTGSLKLADWTVKEYLTSRPTEGRDRKGGENTDSTSKGNGFETFYERFPIGKSNAWQSKDDARNVWEKHNPDVETQKEIYAQLYRDEGDYLWILGVGIPSASVWLKRFFDHRGR